MISTKTQIIQAINEMDDDTVFSVWDMLTRHFDTPFKKITWDDIEEADPDEWDMEMIEKIDSDLDCRLFVSQDELLARRNMKI